MDLSTSIFERACLDSPKLRNSPMIVSNITLINTDTHQYVSLLAFRDIHIALSLSLLSSMINLLSLVVDGSVDIDIRKGMYGLPPAGKLTYDRLKHHLDQYSYIPTPSTPNLWRHSHRPISFTLIVDDLVIKLEDLQYTNHLLWHDYGMKLYSTLRRYLHASVRH